MHSYCGKAIYCPLSLWLYLCTDIYVEHMVNSNREYISSVIINFKIYKRVSLYLFFICSLLKRSQAPGVLDLALPKHEFETFGRDLEVQPTPPPFRPLVSFQPPKQPLKGGLSSSSSECHAGSCQIPHGRHNTYEQFVRFKMGTSKLAQATRHLWPGPGPSPCSRTQP
jgi:hypothetical protein